MQEVSAVAPPPADALASGTSSAPGGAAALPTFEQVYATWFDFVWRSARRLGVGESSLDDVVQDVFLTVHRRLADFEGRSSVKTWLFGIVLRVTRDYRRTLRRKPTQPLTHEVVGNGSDPLADAERAEGLRLLHSLLDNLSDDKREAFVLVELEQMVVPDVAELLQENVNTVYARVRAARHDFEAALRRQRALDATRKPLKP